MAVVLLPNYRTVNSVTAIVSETNFSVLTRGYGGGVDGFGQVIQHHRKRKGWTQLDLANAVGKTVPAVGQWEREVFTPRRATAEQIDRALDAGGSVLASLCYAVDESGEPIGPALRDQPIDTADQPISRSELEAEISQLRALVGEMAVRILRLETQADATTERVHDLMERVLLPDADEALHLDESRTAQ